MITIIHTSAIVEYNIQHYTFLSNEIFTSIFDFNYSLYFSRYLTLLKMKTKNKKAT